MKYIDVGTEFYHRLANRDQRQGDGRYTAVEFREKFLNELDSKEAWNIDTPYITLNFANVRIIGPSFANEVFGYFTIYAKPEKILKKILFKNVSNVQMGIIETELAAGYTR
jgi:hypothetical protein